MDRADEVGSILLDNLGKWVDQPSISEVTGISYSGVYWCIFQLREAGWVVETALYADPAAFNAGKHGWRLVNFQDTPYRPTGRAPKTTKLRQGDRVVHPELGIGEVAFADSKFQKVRVVFATGESHKVEPSALALLD